MIKKIISLLGLMLVAMLIAAGCTGTASENQASLGQEFTLPVGQSVTIPEADMVIKFDGVSADSRSPKGVETIWVGEAKIDITITSPGSDSHLVLTEKGNTDGDTRTSFGQYTINFRLEPYPEAGKQPAANEYRLVMKITR